MQCNAVCAVLTLFKTIYIELITALPLNGGTYSALLQCTGKVDMRA